jgi:hypothetical protein
MPTGPVNRVVVVPGAVLQQLLALEDHWDPWDGEDQHRPECGPLPGIPAAGVARVDVLGEPAFAVAGGDLVVGFGVDDALQRIAVVPAPDRLHDGVQIPVLIPGPGQRMADRVQEAGVPLGVEPGPAGAGALGDPLVVLHVLGDAELPWLAAVDLVVDPAHQLPAVGEVGARVAAAVDVADVAGGIPAEPVEAVLLQPQQRVVAEELADLGPAVVRAGMPHGVRSRQSL